MHVDIGVAEYNIEIGPSLIGPLIRELEEDPDNNLIVIDKAVANHVKEIYGNINGLNVIELTAGKESKTFYAPIKSVEIPPLSNRSTSDDDD